MRKEVELQLLPSETENDAVILAQAARACHLPVQKITQLVPLRRSIDARGKQPIVRLKVAIYAGEFFTGEPALLDSFQWWMIAPKSSSLVQDQQVTLLLCNSSN